MKIIEHKVHLDKKEYTLELMDFDSKDKIKLGELGARGANLPEGISEIAFCLFSGSKRFYSMKLNKGKKKASASFDTFNIKTDRTEQIKACSVEGDLTSFGPKSEWDDLYFLDFYRDGKIDGSFDVYKIDTKLIYSVKVNANQLFGDQKDEKRRPRFSIKKEIIEKQKLKPIAKNVIVW